MIHIKRPRLILLTTIAFSIIFITAGCLQIKQQTIVARFSEDGKKMELLLVYEGLYVSSFSFGDKESDKEKARKADLEKAKKELADFVASEQQFSLGTNWVISPINLKPEPEDSQLTANRKRLLLKALQIRNVAFLLNERNELSGYQIISFDIREFVNTFNDVACEAIDELVTAELTKPRDDTKAEKLSDTSLRQIQRASRKGHKWIKITPGQITFTLPITKDDANLIVAESETTKSQEEYRNIRKAVGDIRISSSDAGLSVVLGDGSKKTFHYQSDRRDLDGLFEGELLSMHALSGCHLNGHRTRRLSSPNI